MKNSEFAEKCKGAAKILEALALQTESTAAAEEMAFSREHAAETIAPLAEIVAVIAGSAG